MRTSGGFRTIRRFHEFIALEPIYAGDAVRYDLNTLTMTKVSNIADTTGMAMRNTAIGEWGTVGVTGGDLGIW